MTRYRLRTLLIVLALGPMVLAGYYFLLTRSTGPLAHALGIAVGTVTTTLIVVMPLLALDWLVKRMRR
jgi:hypothetical protein